MLFRSVINAEVSYHVLLGRPWLHKHHLIPSMFHQCIKGRLNGKPIRIPANHNPFSQGEVNFAETMFYDELGPDDENPAPGTLGAPILEEEEGGRGTRDLRNLLEKKKTKEGAQLFRIPRMCCGAGAWGKANLSFVKVRGTRMHCAGRSRTTKLHDGPRRNPRRTS